MVSQYESAGEAMRTHLAAAQGSSSIPLKRSPSEDDKDWAGTASGPSDAQRAYLAHNASHIMDIETQEAGISQAQRMLPIPDSVDDGGLHLASTASAKMDPSTGPSSARQSPMASEDELDQTLQVQGRSTPPVGGKQSHHAVPRGYRGPVPLKGDAEEIASAPSLVPVPGMSAEAFNVINYPLNRNGWRYTAAGPATQILPFGIYRTLETEPRGVHWSWSDRSPYTHISADASTVTAEGGFRSARANIPVRSGAWYAEVHILPPEPSSSRSCGDSPHVRVGWARREAALNAPVGCNGYSYGIRDASGEKVFLARTYGYGKPFGTGDVVGLWISLPAEREASADDRYDTARIQRKRLPIRYKGRLYFESLEYATTKEMDHLMDRSRRGEKLHNTMGSGETIINADTGLIAPVKSASIDGRKKAKGASGPPGAGAPKSATSNLRPLPTLGSDSKMGFFINGEPQGIAFENLLDFRPLPQHRSAKKSGAKNSNKAAAGLTFNGLGENEADSVITTSSTAASILKSRENHYDDGALGYFPFVSLYGGAKARLVTRAEDFKYPPPSNIAEALCAADDAYQRRAPSSMVITAQETRALGERYDEYMEEMLKHDIEEEATWRALILKRQAEEDEEERDSQRVKSAGAKKSTSKRKGGAGAAPSPLAAPGAIKGSSRDTPSHEEQSSVVSSRAITRSPAPDGSARSSPLISKGELLEDDAGISPERTRDDFMRSQVEDASNDVKEVKQEHQQQMWDSPDAAMDLDHNT